MKKFLVVLFAFLTMALSVNAEPVMYNTATQKVHKAYCQHAKKCTVNCIKIERQDAYKRGGKPCKVCGG
jgi:hypothetical protein